MVNTLIVILTLLIILLFIRIYIQSNIIKLSEKLIKNQGKTIDLLKVLNSVLEGSLNVSKSALESVLTDVKNYEVEVMVWEKNCNSYKESLNFVQSVNESLVEKNIELERRVAIFRNKAELQAQREFDNHLTKEIRGFFI